MDSIWTTVTHARLRARQGDTAGARTVLQNLLAHRPNDTAARSFLEELESGPIAPPNPPRVPAPAEDPARAALVAQLAQKMRLEFKTRVSTKTSKVSAAKVRRLTRWMNAVISTSQVSLPSRR